MARPSESNPRVGPPRSASKIAAALIPSSPTSGVARSRKTCKACDLWKHATQTVFGEDPTPGRVMFVGEQPGDSEDRAGHPFVGPAGRLLDEVLSEVGIDRSEVYVTNVVKHFKWVTAQRGGDAFTRNLESRKLKRAGLRSMQNFRLFSRKFWSTSEPAQRRLCYEKISA